LLITTISYLYQLFPKRTVIISILIIVFIVFKVAICGVTQHSRRGMIDSRIHFIQQIIDAEISYKAIHGKFYIGKDFNRTITELKIEYPSNIFEYNIKAGETTILIKANKKGENNYIYMFYPKKNSNKIKGYNQKEWKDNLYVHGYINGISKKIDLQNDGNILSTYKDEKPKTGLKSKDIINVIISVLTPRHFKKNMLNF
jgi:hypothetical protein